jgi:hypothetical protein
MTIEYFLENWENIDEKDVNLTKDAWHYICYYQTLSESFIEKYKDYVNWHHISVHQNLSESFILESRNQVSWDWVSRFQTLSDIFIIENHNYIDYSYLKYNKNIEYKLYQSQLGRSLLIL